MLFSAIALMALSCKKKNTIPVPEFGSLGGSITPIGSAWTVYATDAAGFNHTAEVSPATGNFSFGSLTAGNYTITAPVDSRFKTMGKLVAQVVAVRHTDLGTLSFTPVMQSSGAVSGSLLPIGFGERVTATSLSTGQSYKVEHIAASGKFILALPNGEYLLSFTAVRPAQPPADMTVTIAGNMVDLGSLVFKQGISGSIVAKVSPISGISEVKATHVQTGELVMGSVNRIDGTIGFPVMMPGDYRLVMSTYAPYLVPAVIEAKVLKGKQTDLGELSLVQDMDIRILAYNMDGKRTVRYNVSATLIRGELKFNQTTLTNSRDFSGKITSNYFTLTATMDNITGPGIYYFNGSANSTLTYTETRKSSINTTMVGSWGVNGITSTGKMEILSIDPVARRIRGVFSGVLSNQTTGALPIPKTVSDGVFHLDYQ